MPDDHRTPPNRTPALPTSSFASRNLRAEARALEEGHRSFLIDANPIPAYRAYRVVSDTYPGKAYIVNGYSVAEGAPLNLHCRPDRYSKAAGVDDHLDAISPYPGVVPCKHAALVVRRWEREGHAVFDGERWLATATFSPVPDIDLTDPDTDPFEGL